jgi:hypothetical protein
MTACIGLARPPIVSLQVARDTIVQSSITQLKMISKPHLLKVTFTGEVGAGDGVTRVRFCMLVHQFHVEYKRVILGCMKGWFESLATAIAHHNMDGACEPKCVQSYVRDVLCVCMRSGVALFYEPGRPHHTGFVTPAFYPALLEADQSKRFVMFACVLSTACLEASFFFLAHTRHVLERS